MKKKHLMLSAVLILSGLISGCSGSSGPSPSSITGKVVDGYLVNATVFLDKNDNYQLDQGEAFTTTNQDGAYTLAVDPADLGRYPLVALAIKDQTTDLDDGQTVQNTYVLSSPANATLYAVISPMSTQVRELLETGKYATIEQAVGALATKLGLPLGTDVMGDYVRSGDTLVHTAAQSISGLMGSQMSNVLGTNGPSVPVSVNRYRAMVGMIFSNLSSIKGTNRAGDSYSDVINLMNSKLPTIPSNQSFRNMSSAFRPDFFRDSISPVFCSKPMPVSGQTDSLAPGYIVEFKDGVDARSETARLANLYQFTPDLGTLITGGFGVKFNSPVLLGHLRCQTSIKSLYYNASVGF